jgi:hypothetical protein
MSIITACGRCKADRTVKGAIHIEGNRDCDTWMVTLECGHMREMTTYGGKEAKELKRLASGRKITTNYPISRRSRSRWCCTARAAAFSTSTSRPRNGRTRHIDPMPARRRAAARSGVQPTSPPLASKASRTKGKSDNWEPEL